MVSPEDDSGFLIVGAADIVALALMVVGAAEIVAELE